MRIICRDTHLNPSLTWIQIFHIRHYLYPYPKVSADIDMVKAISDPISEGWVLDNDIHMEETIL